MVSNNSPSNENQAPGPKQVSDLPSKKPDQWFAVGVAAAILLMVSMGWLALYILSLPSTWAERGQAMQVFQPFLVGMAGIVTLCTVIWRGLINEAQANEQRRQNDAKDMADVGLLLEKATTFLSDESLMKRGVGLAMLDTVVTTPNSPYANFAIELVVDQLVPAMNMGGEGLEAVIQQIERTLQRAHELDIHASRERTYAFSNQESFKNLEFSPSPYLPRGSIVGAVISVNSKFQQLDMLSWARGGFKWDFENCRFIRSRRSVAMFAPVIRISQDFESCIFDGVHVRSLETDRRQKRENGHKFLGCNFSRAHIRSLADLDSVELIDCHYIEKIPPIISDQTAEQSVQLIQERFPSFGIKRSIGLADLVEVGV